MLTIKSPMFTIPLVFFISLLVVIAHTFHGHTPVINWAVCLGQKVSSNSVRSPTGS